jgi:hypothetical protein
VLDSILGMRLLSDCSRRRYRLKLGWWESTLLAVG